MTSPTPVLPVEHTVDGLMSEVEAFGQACKLRGVLAAKGKADPDVDAEIFRTADSIRTYAEKLASPPPQPAPGEVRMLTTDEMKSATMPWRDLGWALRSIQRKFAEVNGLKLATPQGGQQHG